MTATPVREREEALRTYLDHKPLELRIDLDNGETAVDLAYGNLYAPGLGETLEFVPARFCARRKAQGLLKDGVWHDDALYPGRRITKIAIVEQPKTVLELQVDKLKRDKAASRIVEEHE